MCVDLTKSKSAFEDEIYFKILEVLGDESLVTPYQLFPVQLDRVYFVEDGPDIKTKRFAEEELSGCTVDAFYPRSFHVCRPWSLFRCFIKEWADDVRLEITVPCLVADIVAADNAEVAARVMYLFSKEEWERYNRRCVPVKINENDFVVEESEV
jgi:hypothetical protein